MVTAPSVRGLHELARAHALKLLVLRVGCSYRQRLETVLASRGIVDARTQEFGSLDAIVGCVAAGLGITLLPLSVMAAAARIGEVALHALPHEATVDTLFIRRRDGFTSSALAAFIQLVLAGIAETMQAAAE